MPLPLRSAGSARTRARTPADIRTVVKSESLGVRMDRVMSLPMLDSIGLNDANSLLRRYIRYWLAYQAMPLPVFLVGWYAYRLSGAAHIYWFWPLMLGLHCVISFVCAFQAALFHSRNR